MTRITESNAKPLHSQHNYMKISFKKKTLIFVEIFVCFSTFVVRNLPARGRKSEKNKEIALPEIIQKCVKRN
jgi:hypothetical protein